MTDVFFALSHPTRREIVRLLRAGERSAGDLARAFPLAKSTLSAHFGVLKRAGLVTAERRGTSIRYRLNVSRLETVVATLLGWLDAGPARLGAGRPSAATTALPAPRGRPSPRRRQHVDPVSEPETARAGTRRMEAVRTGAGLVLLAGGAWGAGGAGLTAPGRLAGATVGQPGRDAARPRTTRRLGLRLLQPVRPPAA